MRIVLDIPQQTDLDWLLKLFQQLNLRVVQAPGVLSENGFSESAAPLPEPPELQEHWASAVKPIRQSQSIEDMIVEQNYKGFDLTRMDAIIESLDIQEPVEELRAQLTP